MSEMKKQVLKALIKSMHGMMKSGSADSSMGKSGLADALEEAKDEALEDPKEEALESPAEEAAEDEEEIVPAVKKKQAATISVTAIRKGSMKPAVPEPKPQASHLFKKK